MTPTYTPDDISLWRELRYAFDHTDCDYKAFCYLSSSFELAYNHLHREKIKTLARKFLASSPNLKCSVGDTFLFHDLGTPSNTARSLFIDWNIQRLSSASTTKADTHYDH